MTTSTIWQAPVCELDELNNLFIELTAKNCNNRCKHCYIDFPITKHVKDFIPIETIKDELASAPLNKLQCIYLTGAEPMTHPDFNAILRLGLKYSNVCICTNGSFINEKKARFLKRVQSESNYEIIFQLSIDHYNEVKCDDIRGRGAYRLAVLAIKNLVKYDFNPIISITDYYNEGREVLINEFMNIANKIGFPAELSNFKINKYYDKNNKDIRTDFEHILTDKLDCQNGRILTAKGVYTCPFLANDHRGRCGGDLTDFSKKNILETDFCATCIQNKNKIFAIDFSQFVSD